MRGIHVRGFEEVSFHEFFVENSVEVNFSPSFVVAKVAMTALWGNGAGGIHVAALRRRTSGGSEETQTFHDDQAFVWGPDITSVTFKRQAWAKKNSACRVVSVAEVQFW
jgi:hypothetical protein